MRGGCDLKAIALKAELKCYFPAAILFSNSFPLSFLNLTVFGLECFVIAITFMEKGKSIKDALDDMSFVRLRTCIQKFYVVIVPLAPQPLPPRVL